MGILKEFKDFAMKGNIIDLATAVIIGGAFGKVVSSLVNDILMPPIGVLLGNVNFKDLKVVVQEAVGEKAAVTLNYGMFVQSIVDFVIIAFSIFVVIKAYKRMEKKREEAPAPAAPPAPTNEEKLLTEIRDLLKAQK
ncbi:large-conductance mechanosensitive channel protein MscL [Imperialibacter roseus]|uniref:Large-conductance mechanosensitive channel n=1 Tax=Imperialibacter roseus TaxID=1324217 RepID=A0ABZ0IUL6_9BACT|nr:large-conductance mechanosensitive channel protein MscL [Imperialibacter roseus]WOK08728.1 large-conductance mechanosensitive channel protein MscL [Imperialibacter roseus]|tara:strand:+ start:6280 stop:6690 length:411 start_codon:yes stop_codon:yes gene_type:complete